MFPALSPEETQVQLRAIFGEPRKKRAPEDCDHCLHAPDGMPLYGVKEAVPNPVCCECGTTFEGLEEA